MSVGSSNLPAPPGRPAGWRLPSRSTRARLAPRLLTHRERAGAGDHAQQVGRARPGVLGQQKGWPYIYPARLHGRGVVLTLSLLLFSSGSFREDEVTLQKKQAFAVGLTYYIKTIACPPLVFVLYLCIPRSASNFLKCFRARLTSERSVVSLRPVTVEICS